MSKPSARSLALVLATTLLASSITRSVWAEEPREFSADNTADQPAETPPPTKDGEPGKVVELPKSADTPKDAEPVKLPEPEFIARNSKGELVIRDDAAGFGRAGQAAFSSDAALSIQEQTTTHASNSRITSITLAPSADWFVLKNLSIGGVVGLTYAKTDASKGARLTVGPRIGNNFEISRLLSIWPRIGFFYAHTTNTKQALGAVPGAASTFNNPISANAVALSIFIPLMVHPAPHFFAGFGPFMDSDLSGYHRATVLGVKLTIGGWINREGMEEDES